MEDGSTDIDELSELVLVAGALVALADRPERLVVELNPRGAEV